MGRVYLLLYLLLILVTEVLLCFILVTEVLFYLLLVTEVLFYLNLVTEGGEGMPHFWSLRIRTGFDSSQYQFRFSKFQICVSIAFLGCPVGSLQGPVGVRLVQMVIQSGPAS